MVSTAKTAGVTAETHGKILSKENCFLIKRVTQKGRIRIVLKEYVCGISEFNLGMYREETLWKALACLGEYY
jgi:hypothetical protein